MNDTPHRGLPGSDDTGVSATDVDPRFDDAAVGTAPPRAELPATVKSPQEQFAKITAACGEWVRDKPMQALAVAAGVGFLLGRSGR